MNAPAPASRSASCAMQALSGQALVEFLASLLVLAPLFMLLPTLGRYLDIAFATQIAARYAAFNVMRHNASETPVGAKAGWQSADALQRELGNRFFGKPGSAILASDLTRADKLPAGDPLWVKPEGGSLIPDRAAAIRVGYGKADSPDPAAGADKASDTRPFAELQPWMPRCVYGLDAHGIYTVNVSVKLSNLRPSPLLRPFDAINLAMQRHTSVLYGSWSALDDAQVAQRVARNTIVYPTTILKTEFDAASFALLAIDPLSFVWNPSGYKQLLDVANSNLRGFVFYPVPIEEASVGKQPSAPGRRQHVCGTLAQPSW